MIDLESLVAVHSEAVWRTIYRLLNHHEDALDCYQETFLAAVRLADAGEVRHWRAMLVTIATRRAVHRLRERYRNDQAKERVAEAASGRSVVAPPDAAAQERELQERVRRALATLPALQAEAFWLRHLEQLSPAEVATAMQIEPGHVRVLVHRAAAGLRELLGPSYGPRSFSEESP
jgi:RNA polymerase sigma-70 factor, ECF subfamily